MNCKTCKHWNTWPAGGSTVGECKRIEVAYLDPTGHAPIPKPKEILVRVGDDDDDGDPSVLIMTSENFGCTLHEPREQ